MFASGKTASASSGASSANYIEDVFSTYLYTGNNTARSITNNIDLSTKGGLVWIKERTNAGNHYFVDTARGNTKYISSNGSAAQLTFTDALTAFTTTGFNLGVDASAGDINGTNQNYGSWTFRKQPKFFDVVTYTGNGAASQTISHGLGSTPGCVIIKSTSSGNWNVWAKDDIYYQFGLQLNSSAASGGRADLSADITSTTLDVGSAHLNQTSNTNGVTYVAYLFANNSGGFGLTGTDNVITCSSYTGNGSATGPTITLGYEPQWLLIKNADSAGNWQIIDNMRGMTIGGSDALLQANLSNAESSADYVNPTATGFQITSTSTEVNRNGYTYVYIAIRRGPMKVPTSGTGLYTSVTGNNSGSTSVANFNAGFPVDMALLKRMDASLSWQMSDRLRQPNQLVTNTTAAEDPSSYYSFDFQNGWFNLALGSNYRSWMFRRAPSFFDEVCYTGDGAFGTQNHNLGVRPDLIITKARSGVGNWVVQYVTSSSTCKLLYLNSSNGSYADGSGYTFNSTVYGEEFAANGTTYVSYLFATAAGVSKVGSYTGTGTTLQVNCGFTGGARFVLIKRTDSTGDWYVWDSARGIVSGNDPYLLLNSTAAEVTNTDYVDTYSAGFEISSTAPAAINASGGTFIFLAIA